MKKKNFGNTVLVSLKKWFILLPVLKFKALDFKYLVLQKLKKVFLRPNKIYSIPKKIAYSLKKKL